MSEYEPLRDRILSGFGTSFALKDTIRLFDKRDCLDALRDAEMMVKLFDLKAGEAVGGEG